MGLFSKKEKTSEEELVDYLVGTGLLNYSDNLNNALEDISARSELDKIVKEAWKNGASVSEIQRVYDENLLRLKDSVENKQMEKVNSRKETEKEAIKETKNDSIKSSKSVSLRVCIIPTIIIIILVAGGIYGIFFLSSSNENETSEKITLGGVTFNIPPDYTFLGSDETADAFVNKYEDYVYRKSDRTKDYLEIHVYKNKSVQQVVSNISSSEGLTAEARSYGNYSGYWFDHDLFKFRNYFFIFEKNGKTVGISFSSPYQDKVIENL